MGAGRQGGVLMALALRSLRANRVRTAATVAGVALACALFLAVGVSAASVYLFAGDVARAQSGAYNGTVVGADEGAVRAAADAPGVTALTWLVDEGWARVDTMNSLTPYLHVTALPDDGAAADAFARLTGLRLTAGRMPQAPGEVVVPQSFVDAGSVAAGVGDELRLSVGVRVSDDGRELGWSVPAVATDGGDGLAERLEDTHARSFTVVGLYADSPALMYAGGVAGSYWAGFPAITVAGAGQAGDGPECQAWLAVSDPAATMTIMGRAFDLSAVVAYENSTLNRVTGFDLSRGVYATVLGFSGVVCLAVVLGSALLIRNSFAISVTQRTRQFGLLSSVGATGRQLRGLVLREALMIDAVAVPLGVALGVAGSYAVLGASSGLIARNFGGADGAGVAFHVTVPPALVAIAAVLAVVTTLLAAWGPARRASRLGAMDAVRSAADVRVPAGVERSGAAMRRLFGAPGLLAARGFRRDARPRRALTASLACSVVLVATAALLGSYSRTFLAAVAPSASGAFGRGYDLSYTFSEDNVDTTAEVLTPQNVAARLGTAQGVDDSAYALALDDVLVRVGEGATPADAFDPAYLAGMPRGLVEGTMLFVEDDAYRAWLGQAGLPADELMGADDPRAVAVNRVRGNDGRVLSVGKVFARDGFTLAAWQRVGSVGAGGASGAPDAGQGLGLEARALADTPGDALGDAVGSVAQARVTATPLTVGALSDEVPWWVGVPAGPVFLMPLSAADAVVPGLAGEAAQRSLPDRSWDVWFRASDDARAQASLTAALQDVGLSPVRLVNVAAKAASERANYALAQVFLWSFASITALIALTGAFNAAYTSVTLRRRELAMLRSCGLTRRGLAKQMACESLLYAGRVALWSVPAALAVSLALWRSLARTVAGVPYELPWGVLPALAAVLLVSWLAQAAARRCVDDRDLVGLLRTEAV